jgi:hypothetical protein
MIIRRETLKAVLPATRADDTRYALNAIQIQPDGRCVATNGHILLVAQDKTPERDEDFPTGNPNALPAFQGNPEKPILLDRDKAERLIAAMPKKATIPILHGAQLSTNGDGGAVISATDLEVPCVVHLPADDTRRFPEWQHIVPPKDRPEIRIQLAVNVLKALIKAAEAVADRRSETGGIIEFRLPTGPQHQGRLPLAHSFVGGWRAEPGDICEHEGCGRAKQDHHGGPDGQIIDKIRVRVAGVDVDIDGVVMPCQV